MPRPSITMEDCKYPNVASSLIAGVDKMRKPDLVRMLGNYGVPVPKTVTTMKAALLQKMNQLSAYDASVLWYSVYNIAPPAQIASGDREPAAKRAKTGKK